MMYILGNKNIFTFSIISRHCYGTGSWNSDLSILSLLSNSSICIASHLPTARLNPYASTPLSFLARSASIGEDMLLNKVHVISFLSLTYYGIIGLD